jgi:hypothetical protein
MEYTFINQEGKKEKVAPERWVWGVIYFDNSEFHQFGEKGDYHQIGEIDWDRVKMFTMYRADDIRKRFDLLVTKDMQVFHFYRNARLAGQEKFVKVYVFGYKIRGTSKAVYHFILPDDRMLISSQNNVDLSLFELERN